MTETFLYHGSDNKNLFIIKPHNQSVRHSDEGSVIFATPDSAYAYAFTVRPRGRYRQDISRWRLDGVETPWHITIDDEAAFRYADLGGAVYRVAAEQFTLDATYDHGTPEWTAHAAVVPVDKTIFTSSLKAMLEQGLQVHFVSPAEFDQIKVAQNHGWEIVKELPIVLE
jgi:hypothetical protein